MPSRTIMLANLGITQLYIHLQEWNLSFSLANLVFEKIRDDKPQDALCQFPDERLKKSSGAITIYLLLRLK